MRLRTYDFCIERALYKGYIMMKFYSNVLLAGTLTLSPSVIYAQEELTGDTRLACEAVLCLSSSVRPAECSPALTRYFNILVYSKGVLRWGKTVSARKAFLNMCPASSNIQTADMPTLIDDIANGAGRCDSDFLNSRLRTRKTKMVCTDTGRGGYRADNESCTTVEYFEISNKKPTICRSYEENTLTELDGAKYVGTPINDGRWVSAGEYDEAQREWETERDRVEGNLKARGKFSNN